MTFAEKIMELSRNLFNDLTYEGPDGKRYEKEPIGHYPIGNGQILVGTRKEYLDYISGQVSKKDNGNRAEGE